MGYDEELYVVAKKVRIQYSKLQYIYQTLNFSFFFQDFSVHDQTIEEVKGKGKTLKTRRYSKGTKVRQIVRFFVAEKIRACKTDRNFSWTRR